MVLMQIQKQAKRFSTEGSGILAQSAKGIGTNRLMRFIDNTLIAGRIQSIGIPVPFLGRILDIDLTIEWINILEHNFPKNGLVAGLVRGDHEINPVKMKNLIGCEWLLPAAEKTIDEKLGLPCGYIGPVGLDIPVYADQELAALQNFVTGANKSDTHFTGVQVKRDLKIKKFGDLRRIISGDPCPRCDEGKYQVKRGIEVGHIFKLGTKYSDAMWLNVLDQDQKKQSVIMAKRYNLEKTSLNFTEIEKISSVLELIQDEMLKKARKEAQANTIDISEYSDFKSKIEKGGFFNSPWCGKLECEDAIKEETGAEIRVVPFGSEDGTQKCIYCGEQSTAVPIFARGY